MLKHLLSHITGLTRPYNRIKTPTLLQLSETECGITCLAILLAWHQHPAPIETLREQCGTSRDGTRAITLLKVARQHGFDASAWKMEPDDIRHLREPVIAFWNFCHYVVINGAGKNRIFINDPAGGPACISLQEFDRAFTGVVLSITPKTGLIKKRKKSLSLQLLQSWPQGFKKETLFIVACMAVGLLSPFFSAALSTVFVDKVILSGFREWIPWLTALLTGFTCLFTGTLLMQKWHHYKFHTKASLIKSSQIITHILKLPLLFYSIRQKSEIVATVSRAEAVVSTLARGITSGFLGVLTLLVCLGFMIGIDWLLALSSLFTTLCSLGTARLISRIHFSNEQANAHAMGKLYSHAISSLRNLETIKACGLQAMTLGKWSRYFSAKLNIAEKISTATAIITAFTRFYSSLSLLIILCLGGFRVSQGIMTTGNLMAYYTLHLFFSTTLTALLQSFKEIQNASASQLRINDILEQSIDLRFQRPDRHPALSLNDPLVLSCHDLYFYYNIHSEPVLQGIHLTIRPGEHIALVGGTGSGKSTLAKILCGLLPPCSGHLTLNGEDISLLSPSDLARIFSHVSQEISLFSGTLYDNLILGSDPPPAETLSRAIQDACLNPLTADRGLNGWVDENGENFSGGERQRIDIVRALVQDTPVLVLDEATSALDSETEKRLIGNIRRLKKTVIHVAHRLSTVRHCDQIIVLEKGKIIEQGTHQRLSERRGHYYRLLENELTTLSDTGS